MINMGGRQTGRTVAAIEGLRAQQRCGLKVLYVCTNRIHEQYINRLYPDIPTKTMNADIRGSKAVVLWDHLAIEAYTHKKDIDIERLRKEINKHTN
jgi:hypothetical protein